MGHRVTSIPGRWAPSCGHCEKHTSSLPLSSLHCHPYSSPLGYRLKGRSTGSSPSVLNYSLLGSLTSPQSSLYLFPMHRVGAAWINNCSEHEASLQAKDIFREKNPKRTLAPHSAERCPLPRLTALEGARSPSRGCPGCPGCLVHEDGPAPPSGRG